MAGHSYDITVFGQSFKITSEKSENDVKVVAAYVDSKMREQAKATKTIAPLRVAIMMRWELRKRCLRSEHLDQLRKDRSTNGISSSL